MAKLSFSQMSPHCAGDTASPNHWWASSCDSSSSGRKPVWPLRIVAAEQRAALGLHRQPAEAVGHGDAVAVERVGAEQVVEEVDLIVDGVEIGLHDRSVGGQDRAQQRQTTGTDAFDEVVVDR